MAARSIATATVSFGLVSIPVKLYTTAQTTEGISFRMLHGKCKTPLKQQYVCPTDGEKVEWGEVVKGYEFAKDQYVIFTAEEIKALEEEATKAIIIEEFVPLPTVDPLYFDKAYYLAPDKGGERAYRLLSRALTQTGLGGLARYAARGKQYIIFLRPFEEGLLMQQLKYAQEVKPFSEIPVGNNIEVKDAELNLALQLLQQSTSEEFRPEKFTDETVARFQETLQKKLEGEQLSVVRGEAPPAKVIDLMEALKASLAKSGEKPEKADKRGEEAGAGNGGKQAASGGASARRPAKAAPKQAAESGGKSRARGRG